MRDRIPGAPGQYTAVVTSAELQKLQNAEQFTITLMRDDQPLVEGTPYSKAAVLPDEVASQLCPEVDDPTPADAFQAAAQHLLSSANPHGVTAAQIGAAPDGYGLGGYAALFPWQDVDNITVNGWYACNSVSIEGVTGISDWGYMSVDCWNHETCTQTLHPSTPLGVSLTRSKNVATPNWSPWEWVNPPMVEGVEYRTTERRNGAAVYKRLKGGVTEYRLDGSSTWQAQDQFLSVARNIFLSGAWDASFTSILRDNWDSIPHTYCGVLTIKRGGNAIGGLYSKATQHDGTVMLFSYALGGKGIAVYTIREGTEWTEHTI